MKLITAFVAAFLAFSSVAWAQQKGPGAANNTLTKVDPLGADAQAAQAQWMDKPLPEVKGVLSWKTLGEVKPVKQKDKFVPEFAKAIPESKAACAIDSRAGRLVPSLTASTIAGIARRRPSKAKARGMGRALREM